MEIDLDVSGVKTEEMLAKRTREGLAEAVDYKFWSYGR
jgi:hypothetical protein